MADVEKAADVAATVNDTAADSHKDPEPAATKEDGDAPKDAPGTDVNNKNGVNESAAKVDEAKAEQCEVGGGSKDDDTIFFYTAPRKYIRHIIPSPSPPALKLETWLRLNKLDYKAVEVTKGSKSTGLMPYVVYKGEEITDSSIVIRELTKRFGLDPTEGLAAHELAISRAFQKMVDENTYWTLIWERLQMPSDVWPKIAELPGPKFTNGLFVKLMSRGIGGRLKSQGMGLLPKDEVKEIIRGDIMALSTFLGDKQFMMGDNPTSLDCSVFGVLSQFLYVDIPSTHREVVKEHCPNIVPYLERVKTAAWPDWDQLYTGKPVL